MPPPGARRRWGVATLSIGIALPGPVSTASWKSQLEWVAQAEALGAHSVWLPEMHFGHGSSPAPLLGLSAIAVHTRRLRLGTSSLLLPIHPPLRVAAAAAALDRVSGGRLLLGLGRGFRPLLFDAFGIDAATKRDLFDASLDAMLAAWSEAAAGGGSRTFATHQTPHPPLAVAAFGRKGLLQSARRGLPYLASPLEPLSQLAENLAFHRDHAPAVDPDPVVPVMRTVHVAGDERELARVRDGLESEGRALGSGQRVPKALAAAAAAPVRERAIVGTAPEVRDRIAEYRERIGVNLLIVRPPTAGVDRDEQHASLARLMEEILPASTRGEPRSIE